MSGYHYAKVLTLPPDRHNRRGQWTVKYFSGPSRYEALRCAYAYGETLTPEHSSLPEIGHVRVIPRSAVPTAKLQALDAQARKGS